MAPRAAQLRQLSSQTFLWCIVINFPPEVDECVRPLLFFRLSFSLRGEATPADSLDVQVLALKAGSGIAWKAMKKGQTGRAMSEMRDLDFHLFTAKLNRTTAWGLGRALLVSFGLNA